MAAASAVNRSLVWGSGSVYAWRVQITLKEKGLPYQSNRIDFGKGEHKSAEILAKNPRGQVPVFTDGDVVICESLAACIYLEETYGDQGHPLLPPLTTKSKERALVWQRFAESENLQKVAMKLFGLHLGMTKLDEEDTRKAWDDFETELGRWDKILGQAKYAAGDDFTLADIMLAPTVMHLWRGDADLSKYPNLAGYQELTKSRPSVESTWPPHWGQDKNSFYVRK